MLKSFVDTTAVRNQRTGTSTYIQHLLDGLCRSDRIGAIIACGGESEIVSSVGESVNDRFTHLPARTPHVSLNFEMAGNRRSISSDICFFPNYFMPFGWPTPAAVTIHDVSFLSHPGFYSFKMRNWYRNRIRHTVSRANVILTVSQASRAAITQHLGIDPNRIIVLPPLDVTSIYRHSVHEHSIESHSNSNHSIDNHSQEIQSASRHSVDNHILGNQSIESQSMGIHSNIKHSVDHSSRDKPYFLYVGTIEPRKNLINLLDGYKAAGIKDIDLVLIGRPNVSASYYRKFLHSVTRTPGAYYLGYQNDTVVTNYMSCCHGLIQLSWMEGFGIPLFQALAKGIPTLISDDPAMLELAGGHALIARPDDTVMIANLLDKLQSRGGCYYPAAAAWCREKWSRRAWCRQLDLVIDRLAQPSTPSRPVLSDQKPDIERAIIEGICYAATFNAPVHVDKLYAGLRNSQTTPEKFRTILNRLLINFPDLFRSAGPLIGLASIEFDNPVRNTSALRRQHRRVLKIIASIPWIRSIYYSGGTVHGTGLEERQDLDLFLVTRSNRSWLSYAVVRLASILSGKRHSVCCNYLVDESAMSITWQREFYTAFQLLHLRQVVRKANTPHMRAVNEWIYEFFPNASRFRNGRIHKSDNKYGFLYCLNLLLMALFEFRWSKKGRVNGKGGVQFDVHRIKLHTRDHRPYVYAQFQKTYNRILTAMQSKKQISPILLKCNRLIPDLINITTNDKTYPVKQSMT